MIELVHQDFKNNYLKKFKDLKASVKILRREMGIRYKIEIN